MAVVATLLTPLVLSISPATINVDMPSYDHASQGLEIAAQMATSQTTFGGTQTFDGGGKPYDSDNDSNRD
jgi:hypothetical protein